MIPGFNEYESRCVRIFISSTFQDMKAERSVLAEDVFPRLRAKYTPRGIGILEVDLRWGIPESLSNNGHVLRLCIEEIDRCKPHFLGILGGRRGYYPDAQEFEVLESTCAGLFDLDQLQGLSICEMEMQVGLQVSTPQSASFHVRAADVARNAHAGPLEEQMSGNGYHCKRYASLSEFREDVFEAICKIVENRFGDSDEALSADYRCHLSRLVAGRRGFVPSPQLLDLLKAAREGQDVHISGNRGTGKTSALCYLAVELGETLDHDVFFHFPSVDRRSPEVLWKRLLRFLGGDASEKVDVSDVRLWLSRHPLKKLTFVIVDDASSFSSHGDVRMRLHALSEIDDRLVVICAASEDSRSWKGATMRLERLAPAQIEEITRQYFGKYGKSLDDEQLAGIGRNEGLGNPLILKCVLGEMRTSLSFDAFAEDLQRIALVKGIDELVLLLGRRVCSRLLDLGLNEGATWETLSLLAFTKGGLREHEILSCSSASILEWTIVRTAFEPLLTEDDGMWFMASSAVRDAVRGASSQCSACSTELAQSRLIGHFSNMPLSPRSVDELAQQFALSESRGPLLCLLGSYEHSRVLCRGRRETFVEYLTMIKEGSSTLASKLSESISGLNVELAELDMLLLSLNESGHYEAAVLLARSLRREAEEVAGAMGYVLLSKHEARAKYKMGTAHYSDSIELYGSAIACVREEIAARDGSDVAATLNRILAELMLKQAIVQKSAGSPRRAKTGYEEAVKVYQALADEGGDASWALGNLASSYYAYGLDAQCAELFDKAIEMRARAFGERSPEVAWTLCYQFSFLFSSGSMAGADRASSDALTFYSESFGETSPQFAWAEVNRANYLVASGKYDEAHGLYVDSIEKNDRLGGGSGIGGASPYSLTTIGNLAVVDWLKGDCEKARSQLAGLQQLMLQAHGANHPYFANAQLNVLLTQGLGEAAKGLPAVIAKLEALFGPDSPDVCFARSALDAARGKPSKEVPGALGGVYLARNNGSQLIVVPRWMLNEGSLGPTEPIRR